jgi:hypothetical protein
METANIPRATDLRNEAINALAGRLKTQLYDENAQSWEAEIASAKDVLDGAVAAGDEDAANRAWFLHNVATVRHAYIRAIERLRKEEYYEGWCALEQVEIGLNTLRKNPFYDLHEFAVLELTTLVDNWQRLFPYHVFFSPEIAIRHEVCSICGQGVDPWSSCTHEPGKVYCGRECYRTVTACELLSISLVREPVQKYSVARVFSTDSNGKQVDQFDCAPVKFVVDRIRSTFTNWSVTWTKALHPHHLFADRAHDEPCPCESGKLYRECCLSADGVIRPHLQIVFEHDPPMHLPNVEYTGYDTVKDHIKSD